MCNLIVFLSCLIVMFRCVSVVAIRNVYYLFDFFFFKQKTAYEMRISDWSSDVCSSDLGVVISTIHAAKGLEWDWVFVAGCDAQMLQIGRASCRERVCQSCRSRWSPYH